ncbi:MAG: outer membrane lipoprotein carrier protein LolA [Azoarcus sp.]|jgi:hypothetical protein|nr:outer membrane lipoprotein carrier protein LolA [Azoarcus sp.]
MKNAMAQASRWLKAAALCGLFLAVPAQAEGDPALLRDIQSRLADDTVIRGNFTQTRQLAGIKKRLSANGSFVVDKTRGVLWRAVKPLAQTTRITQGEILQKDGGQVLMNLNAEQEPAVSAISRVLFSLFDGNMAALAEYFDYRGQPNGGKDGGWQLHFTPRDAGMRAVIASLTLEGDHVVRHVTLTSAAGDVSRIAFSDIATDHALTTDERAQFE